MQDTRACDMWIRTRRVRKYPWVHDPSICPDPTNRRDPNDLLGDFPPSRQLSCSHARICHVSKVRARSRRPPLRARSGGRGGCHRVRGRDGIRTLVRGRGRVRRVGRVRRARGTWMSVSGSGGNGAPRVFARRARARIRATRARSRRPRRSAVREDRAFRASLRAQLRSANSARSSAAAKSSATRTSLDRSDHSGSRPPVQSSGAPTTTSSALSSTPPTPRALIDLADDHAALLDAVSSVSASSSIPPAFPPLVAARDSPARARRAETTARRRASIPPTSSRSTPSSTASSPPHRRGVERGGVVEPIDAASVAERVDSPRASSPRRARRKIARVPMARRCVVGGTSRGARRDATRGRVGGEWRQRGGILEDLGAWTEVRFVATPRAAQGATRCRPTKVPTVPGSTCGPPRRARRRRWADQRTASRPRPSLQRRVEALARRDRASVARLAGGRGRGRRLDFDFVRLPGAAGRRALSSRTSLPPFARKHARARARVRPRDDRRRRTRTRARESAIARGASDPPWTRDAAEGSPPPIAPRTSKSVVAVARSRRDADKARREVRDGGVAGDEPEMHAALCDR